MSGPAAKSFKRSGAEGRASGGVAPDSYRPLKRNRSREGRSPRQRDRNIANEGKAHRRDRSNDRYHHREWRDMREEEEAYSARKRMRVAHRPKGMPSTSKASEIAHKPKPSSSPLVHSSSEAAKSKSSGDIPMGGAQSQSQQAAVKPEVPDKTMNPPSSNSSEAAKVKPPVAVPVEGAPASVKLDKNVDSNGFHTEIDHSALPAPRGVLAKLPSKVRDVIDAFDGRPGTQAITTAAGIKSALQTLAPSVKLLNMQWLRKVAGKIWGLIPNLHPRDGLYDVLRPVLLFEPPQARLFAHNMDAVFRWSLLAWPSMKLEPILEFMTFLVEHGRITSKPPDVLINALRFHLDRNMHQLKEVRHAILKDLCLLSLSRAHLRPLAQAMMIGEKIHLEISAFRVMNLVIAQNICFTAKAAGLTSPAKSLCMSINECFKKTSAWKALPPKVLLNHVVLLVKLGIIDRNLVLAIQEELNRHARTLNMLTEHVPFVKQCVEALKLGPDSLLAQLAPPDRAGPLGNSGLDEIVKGLDESGDDGARKACEYMLRQNICIEVFPQTLVKLVRVFDDKGPELRTRFWEQCMDVVSRRSYSHLSPAEICEVFHRFCQVGRPDEGALGCMIDVIVATGQTQRPESTWSDLCVRELCGLCRDMALMWSALSKSFRSNRVIAKWLGAVAKFLGTKLDQATHIDLANFAFAVACFRAFRELDCRLLFETASLGPTRTSEPNDEYDPGWVNMDEPWAGVSEEKEEDVFRRLVLAHGDYQLAFQTASGMSPPLFRSLIEGFPYFDPDQSIMKRPSVSEMELVNAIHAQAKTANVSGLDIFQVGAKSGLLLHVRCSTGVALRIYPSTCYMNDDTTLWGDIVLEERLVCHREEGIKEIVRVNLRKEWHSVAGDASERAKFVTGLLSTLVKGGSSSTVL